MCCDALGCKIEKKKLQLSCDEDRRDDEKEKK